MSHDIELEPAMLARYFARESSQAEAAAVERWAMAAPERQALLRELRLVWAAGSAGSTTGIDTNAAWAKVTSQLTGYGQGTSQPVLRLERTPVATAPIVPRWTRAVRRLAMAAAVVLALGAGTWLILGERTGRPAAYVTYSSEHGTRRTVLLADGTHATLGPASHLRVALAGQASERRADVLAGQVFFQVAHDTSRPFRVFARGAEARVLGTEFTVRAYDDDDDVQIAVRSGRVAVRGDTSAAGQYDSVLTTGLRARIGRQGAVQVDVVDTVSAFSWITGPLRFESVELGEVAREMSRWIGVGIAVPDDALRRTKVTVVFTDVSPDSVLARLGRLIGTRPVAVRRGFILLGKTESSDIP